MSARGEIDLAGLWEPELVPAAAEKKPRPVAKAKAARVEPPPSEPGTIEAWAGEPRTKKRAAPSIAARDWDAALKRADGFIADGGWDDALPRDFVAAHALLHRKVYGAPLVIGGRERVMAAGAAARVLAREFGGSAEAFVKYVAWVWAREKGREEWRRREGIDGMLTWRAVFGPAVNDYRAAMLRAGARRAS